MLIASISDLEPFSNDLKPLKEMLQRIRRPDLILFAGDLYDYKKPENYKKIVSLLEENRFDCPVFAVFGNREFPQDEGEIKNYAGKTIKFLDDESIILKIENKTIGIVGSRGCLDRPTFWQLKNIPKAYQFYKDRFHKLADLLKKLKTDVKILLTHYAPSYRTMEGEYPRIYPVLGSVYLERVLIDTKTTLAIHGHAESGIPLAFVDSVPVFNVAYRVNRKITEIDIDNLPKSL